MNRHFLRTSFFTTLISASATLAFAQNSAWTNSGSATTKGSTVCTDSSMKAAMQSGNYFWHHGGAFNGQEHAGAPDEAFAGGPMGPIPGMGRGELMHAMKFLYNDEFRASVETPLSAADKQTVESAVTDAKTHIAALKSSKGEFHTAMKNTDTAAFSQLVINSLPHITALMADRKTIRDILSKNKILPNETGALAPNEAATSALAEPVYPNPVHIGGEPAQLTYHVEQAGPVNVVVTDASGNIVRQYTENADQAGAHTVTLDSNLPGAGTYYVTVTANGTKSTQKVQAVQ